MSPKPRPTQQQLAFAVAAGHLDERTHTGRRAATRTCPTCHARVLIGDDAHLAALTATIDPDPLTLAEEALALAAGRQTYTVRTNGGRAEISHRNRRRAGLPAPLSDPREYDYTVHPEHQCAADRRNARQRRKAENA